MAVFRRDKPIDPMHERGICLWLAEHHERRVLETDGWEREDHAKAAKACRERANDWLRIAEAASAPARPQAPASSFPTTVAAPAPKPAAQPKPKPAAAPPKVAGQGDLF